MLVTLAWWALEVVVKIAGYRYWSRYKFERRVAIVKQWESKVIEVRSYRYVSSLNLFFFNNHIVKSNF